MFVLLNLLLASRPILEPLQINDAKLNKIQEDDEEVIIITEIVETVEESFIYEENITLSPSTTIKMQFTDSKILIPVIAGTIVLGAAIIVLFVCCKKRCPNCIPCLTV